MTVSTITITIVKRYNTSYYYSYAGYSLQLGKDTSCARAIASYIRVLSSAADTPLQAGHFFALNRTPIFKSPAELCCT